MKFTWRWFGPNDPIKLSEIKQTSVKGIVSALGHIPSGEVWSIEEIKKLKKTIEDEGLEWSVVESIPVHSDIKRRTGDYKKYIENYKQSLRNVGECGINTVCYNFIPVIDWSRTKLDWRLPDNSKVLKFELKAFAAFDKYILQRTDAEKSYSDKINKESEEFYNNLDKKAKQELTDTILLRLPVTGEKFEVEDLGEMIKSYSHINKDMMKDNLYHFLKEVTPSAEDADVKLAIHGDDPPFSLFGIPRVVSTKQDILDMFNALPSESNGLALCTGSFGAGHFNDIVGMAREFAPRIYFAHLRNVCRDEEGNFYENNHVEGHIDMYSVIKELVLEEKRRKKEGKSHWIIPARPDHGHLMLYDLERDFYPGYSLIGRLKGLSELRGLEIGVQRCLSEMEK